MNRHFLFSTFYFFLTATWIIGRAQSSSVSDARLHASVQVDSSGVFAYRYSVENGARSTTGVWKITVDISSPPGISKLSAIDLSAPQPGWTTSVGTDATARWIAMQDASFVLPRQALGGFSLASRGPPAVRRFILSPHIDPDRAPIMPPGDDPGDVDRYNQDFDRYVESQSVEGMTLAPSAPRALTADALLASLVNQLAQARSAGWISNDAMTLTLRGKLEAARTAFSRRQLEAARSILHAVRDEVAAQSGKNLTSEAVALLDVSIQYILQLAAKP